MFLQANQIKTVVLLSSLIPIFVGLVVILGWYTSNKLLVQIHDSFAPMQMNTAVGFLFSGMGLVALLLCRNKLSALVGIAVFALGVATLIEYIARVDFGIDNFLVDPVFLTKTSHPGRMAPNTALCFSMFGLVLMINSYARTFAIGTSIAVFVLSLLSLIGYFIEHETLYGWGNLTRMAIHTAFCFAVLSAGVILYGFSELVKLKFDFWKLTPAVVSITVIALTIFAWYATEEEAQARNDTYIRSMIDKTEDAILDRYGLYEANIIAGLGLFYASQNVEPHEWKRFVNTLNPEETLPGINGIGYIDFVLEQDLENYLEKTKQDGMPGFQNHPNTRYVDKFIIRYIEPIQNNVEAVGLDIGFEVNRRLAAERARDLGVPSLTKKIELVQDRQKQPGFLLLVPAYEVKDTPETVEKRREHIKGWVYAPFIALNFFSGIDKINGMQLDFSVYDGASIQVENLIYQNSNKGHHARNDNEIQTTFNIAGRDWTILWSVSEKFSSPSNQNLSTVFLVFGFILALLLYFTLSRLLHSRHIISREVESRTRELQEAEQSLRHANEELEEFAYRTSHDLRSPLVSSLGLLDIVQESIEKDNKKTALESVKHIKNSLNKLEVLVKDILALTQTKNAEEERQMVNVEELIDDALSKFSNMENYDRITILKNLEYTDPLCVQKSRLMLIIENLISNAIKYQDPDKKSSYIKLSTQREDHQFVLKIEDNGLGIPEDQQGKIFMMFKRFHNRVAFGSGLGLYMMKKSAHVLGGDIFYRDTGDGSLFALKIPV